MKSSKTKIILGIIFLIFLTIFSGAYFYAKSQVSPEKVREHTLNILNKTFPKSKITLGKVDLGFGFAVKINIDSLTISGPKHKLVALNNFNIRIPIFSILTGGGNLQVSLDSPTLHYIEYSKGNNWTQSLVKNKVVKKKARKSKSSKMENKNSLPDSPSKLVIPSFLINSTVSVDIKKLDINYKLKDKSSGKLYIERILFKKLGLNNSSAYEIKSTLKYKVKSGDELKVNALLIGQFNLSQFISKGELETVSELKLMNTVVPGLKNTLPEIKTKLKTNVDSKGAIKIDLETSFLNNNKVSLNVLLKNGKVKVTNIKTELLLSDIFKIADIKIESLKPGKSKLAINGEVSLSKKGTIVPKINFSIGPELTYIDKNFTTKTSLKGSLKNRSFKSRAEARVLDGIVVLQNSMRLDLNNLPTITKLPKVHTLINVSNLTIKEGLIQELVYASKVQNNKKKDTSRATNKKTKTSIAKEDNRLPLIPPGEITIKMNNIKIDKEELNLTSKIILSKNKIGIKKTTFDFSRGKGSAEAIIKLSSINKTKGSFKFDLKKFELNGLKPFLPKDILKAISGKFTGKTTGTFSTNISVVKYKIISSMSALNGEIKGVNVSDYIKPIILKVPKVGKKYASKIKNVDGKFQTLSMNGKFTDKLYTFKNFKFIGLGKNVDLRGKGYLSPIVSGKSELLLTYRDPSGKMTKILKKEAGREDLPLRLRGRGFSLKPDINYTIDIVAKTAVKAQGKKELDKFLKKDSNKKKLNKLLKGLFK